MSSLQGVRLHVVAIDKGPGWRVTMQVPERLEYLGKRYSLCSLPLEPYLSCLRERPPFYATPTCLERMYIGTWRIEDELLYLTEIQAHNRGGSAITLGHLFPNSEGPVWAEWFSGILRCPQGKRLKTILLGFESIYEAEQLLMIERGKLVGVEKRINPLPPKISDGEMDIPAFLRRYPDSGPS